MSDHQTNQGLSQPEPAIPGALAEGLRGVYGRGVPVPAEVDAAVLASAEGRGVAIRRRRRMTRVLARMSAVGAVAAAVAIAAVVWPRMGSDRNTVEMARGPEEHRLGPEAGQVGGTGGERDVNGDGRVDILDAFAVARAVGASEQERRIRAIPAPLASWDFNRDGAVDRRDADEVAAAAVRLTPDPAGRG